METTHNILFDPVTGECSLIDYKTGEIKKIRSEFDSSSIVYNKSTKDILDEICFSEIERYVRNKKLENIEKINKK